VRYRIASYAETDEPYLVARVEFFEDEEEDAELLASRARAVTELFERIGRAVRTLNDDRASLPDLPEAEPERLSFLVASAMEMDNDIKQELLELRSGAERLARLHRLLLQAVGSYEERARAHQLAKGNGHAGAKIKFDE
jgi:Lon protease-like protein